MQNIWYVTPMKGLLDLPKGSQPSGWESLWSSPSSFVIRPSYLAIVRQNVL